MRRTKRFAAATQPPPNKLAMPTDPCGDRLNSGRKLTSPETAAEAFASMVTGFSWATARILTLARCVPTPNDVYAGTGEQVRPAKRRYATTL